jgi:UDP-N-acetylglucosamine--N-acetylmuramyl-(pentapeptide) pyrophosphoryl-undecaprenol N-acetylglucosamine transferase
MKPALRIMLVGGGSGGHFYPLISLGEALAQEGERVDLYYIGPEAYDAEALRRIGATFVLCPSGKRRRYASFLNVLDVFKVIQGFFVALYKLYILYPDVIVSKGGYTSVPVILAAAFLNIPIVVHESDTRPGRATSLAARFTKHIAISFEDARPYFKRHDVVFTGIPVRSELLLPPVGDEHTRLGVDESVPTLLVLGGSQGAERLNTLMLESLDELLPHYNIIHQTGKNNFNITVLSARELIADDALLARYRPIAFFDDPNTLNAAYHASSLIISRAGTGTIYEVALHAKPSILIPIPETISHDQKTNAYTYARSGAATVLEETNLGDTLLTEEITRIMKNTAIWSDMARRAQAFAPAHGGKLLAQLTLTVARTHS